MKKFIYLLALMFSMVLTGCSSCQSDNAKQDNEVAVASADYDGVVADFTAGTNNIIALHKQTMFNLVKGKEYEWRNLQIMFNDVIKAENIDDLHITDITSVFCYWDNGPLVQFITSNVKKGMLIPTKIPDVWIEDSDMSNAEIKLSAEDVLEKLKTWNGIIPPSKNMILRLPVGPRNCNAQWVIGNIEKVIFIDAVTGDITDWCPAFPIPNVNGPLGEWP